MARKIHYHPIIYLTPTKNLSPTTKKGELLNRAELSSTVAESKTPISDIKDKRLVSILQINSSKIVDENGEPIVMFHGTRDKFNTFIRRSDIGYHFGTKGTAGVRALCRVSASSR